MLPVWFRLFPKILKNCGEPPPTFGNDSGKHHNTSHIYNLLQSVRPRQIKVVENDREEETTLCPSFSSCSSWQKKKIIFGHLLTTVTHRSQRNTRKGNCREKASQSVWAQQINGHSRVFLTRVQGVKRIWIPARSGGNDDMRLSWFVLSLKVLRSYSVSF
jgi:hypothetical protein